ncbi:MASE1 domain-containing protein [Actinopolymorpha singaporensis]|uniref:Integral membrane sensor domain MASE1 n=1 Tax=Actinopolymorpha singaporensis TaxID=117157 RepID=A0A1H1LMZ8_9ACTN|nr:MASE1 domain-containing protein [Actinopolymorpha singaporensis]SDR75876.1 Integral membrane sensor domain MASE1 [Actinopolymorpha singaporensis]
MERISGLRRIGIVGLQIIAVAAAFYGSAQLGLLVGLVDGQISPFWPPTGIALVALLLLGPRIWPAILLGALLVELSQSPPVAVLPTAAGTTLACVCAYYALRRFGFRTELDRLRDALALVFFAAFGSMLISSTIGTAIRVAVGATDPSFFLPTWLTWWTGDAMGVLFVAPLLLTVVRIPWRHAIPTATLLELIALFAAAFGVVLAGARMFGVLFLAFPLLVWAAWRYQLPGAAPVALLASADAIYAAVHSIGPFTGRGLFDTMVILQMFDGAVALTGLLLSVAIIERDRARREIERTCERLDEVLDHFDRSAGALRVVPPQAPSEERTVRRESHRPNRVEGPPYSGPPGTSPPVNGRLR